jgi:serine/threonine protein kinase
MVTFPMFLKLTSLVLYHHLTQEWKITDFGLTMEGTSQRAFSTTQSRGTTGYRAPELLQQKGFKCTNKVDIWALGCIVHDLVFLRKAFLDDFETLSFSWKQESWEDYKTPLPQSKIIADEQLLLSMTSIMSETFTLDPSKRPTASAVGQRLENLKNALSGATSLLDDATKKRMRSEVLRNILAWGAVVMLSTVLEVFALDITTAPTRKLDLSRVEALRLFSGLAGYCVIRHFVYALAFIISKMALECIYAALKPRNRYSTFGRIFWNNIEIKTITSAWALAAVLLLVFYLPGAISKSRQLQRRLNGSRRLPQRFLLDYLLDDVPNFIYDIDENIRNNIVFSKLGKLALPVFSFLENLVMEIQIVLIGSPRL